MCLIALQCLKLWRTGFGKSETHMCCIGIASFLGLSCFYLPFAFTKIHRSGRPAKKRGRPGSIHHMSGCEVDVGGRADIQICIHTKLENDFHTGQDE